MIKKTLEELINSVKEYGEPMVYVDKKSGLILVIPSTNKLVKIAYE